MNPKLYPIAEKIMSIHQKSNGRFNWFHCNYVGMKKFIPDLERDVDFKSIKEYLLQANLVTQCKTPGFNEDLCLTPEGWKFTTFYDMERKAKYSEEKQALRLIN